MRATTYLGLLFWACGALAQGSLEVLELRHATAEQVLPTLRPLLEPGGVLTGQRNQLIVRTSAANLEELRRALAAIDRPARRLLVSVRFDNAGSEERSGAEVDARISSRGSRVEARAFDTRTASGERVDQRLQVLEGGRATIATGSARPLQLRDGVLVQDIATGFDVVPRVSGDTVTLEIAPRREVAGTVTHGSVQVQRAHTTLNARLGEWVELAGIAESATRDARGIASRTHGGGAADRRIWVRVDEVRP
jgi:hypothetical protein